MKDVIKANRGHGTPIGLSIDKLSETRRGGVLITASEDEEENWSKRSSLGHPACELLPLSWNAMGSHSLEINVRDPRH